MGRRPGRPAAAGSSCSMTRRPAVWQGAVWCSVCGCGCSGGMNLVYSLTRRLIRGALLRAIVSQLGKFCFLFLPLQLFILPHAGPRASLCRGHVHIGALREQGPPPPSTGLRLLWNVFLGYLGAGVGRWVPAKKCKVWQRAGPRPRGELQRAAPGRTTLCSPSPPVLQTCASVPPSTHPASRVVCACHALAVSS